MAVPSGLKPDSTMVASSGILHSASRMPELEKFVTVRSLVKLLDRIVK